MTTHIGKIARLSRRRREGVCRRLVNGRPAGEILKWLNKLKDVRAVLRTQFGGRRINKQNLSAWRRSGYVEWLQLEESRGRMDRLAEKADEVAKRAGKRGLGDRLAILLALEMDGLMEVLVKPEADPEKRWERVRQLHREVSRLRRDDDRVKRTSLREGAREKSKVQGPKSKVQSRGRQQADWDEEPQLFADERDEAWKGKQAGEDEHEHEDENDSGGQAAGQEESRQVKAGEERAWVENIPPTEGPPTQVVARRASRPGYEYVKIYEKGTGFWFMEVPAGWEPVGWKSSMMLDRMKNEEEDLEVQGPGTDGGDVRGMMVRGMKNEEAEARPAVTGNTGLEAEARPAVPVNSQAGKSALQLPGAPVYVPDPDPEVEAYNRWWRMNRNFERFDGNELDRTYAELPQKIAEYQAKMQRGEGAGELAAECIEGAGI